MNQYSFNAMSIQPLRVKLREATGLAILDAAEQIAAEAGLPSASLQAIAERAGVAVGTIYNYFPDRQELFAALFKRRREELSAAIDETTKKHAKEPFAAQLEAFVNGVFTHFDRHRPYLRIALDSQPIVTEDDGKKRPAMQQLQERAARIVRLGVREKRLRDVEVELLATVLVSIVRGVLLMRAHRDEPFAPETARVVSLFLDGAGK
jgi:AcrR family transcriptional regulator